MLFMMLFYDVIVILCRSASKERFVRPLVNETIRNIGILRSMSFLGDTLNSYYQDFIQ